MTRIKINIPELLFTYLLTIYFSRTSINPGSSKGLDKYSEAPSFIASFRCLSLLREVNMAIGS